MEANPLRIRKPPILQLVDLYASGLDHAKPRRISVVPSVIGVTLSIGFNVALGLYLNM